jgi:trans-aconitate methyltransferase
MKNQAQVLNRLHQCAESDLLLVMSGKVDANDCRLKVLDDMKKQSPWNSFLEGKNLESEHYTLSVDQMKNLLHNAGFVVDDNTQVYNETVERKFESVQSLKNYVLGWVGGFASFAQAPTELREKFAHDFIDGYTKHVPAQEDGSITYDVPLLVAKARKK